MRIFTTGIVGAAVVFGAGQSALAADVIAPPPKPPVIAPAPVIVQTWTSCYLGGNVGVGWAHNRVVDEVDPSILIATVDATNIVGGGQIGCDHQVGSHVVIGVQGMLDATALKGSGTGAPLQGADLEGNIPWFATATARLGYATGPNFMIYAKGGGAWDHVDSSIVASGVTLGTASFGLSGWTAGGGAEWKLGPKLSLFGEYDYLGFSPRTVTYTSGDIGTVRQNIQVVLAGLNLRFGGMH